MIPAIIVTTRIDSGEANVGATEILDRYAAELERFGATVDVVDNRLTFDMPFDRPKTLKFSEADLGLVSSGAIDVMPESGAYRVRLTARPRGWFLTLALLPIALLVWGLGWSPAPWRYALAFGGLPLLAAVWILAWLNLSAFLADVSIKDPVGT